MDEKLTFLGRTNWRQQLRPFGIHADDRHAHMYIIGKTGTGKSTLLEALARQDALNGHGFALFDPHGDLVERVYAWATSHGRGDLIYLNVPDPGQQFGFNPLGHISPLRRSLAAAGLVEAFKKIFDDAWGVRLEHFMRQSFLLLLDQPTATLADVPRLFSDPEFRKQAAARAIQEQVRRFWLVEYPSYPLRMRAEAVSPILNKVGAFLADPFLYRILSAEKSTFDLREVIDSGKILLVNIAKGRIGEGPAAVFGALLMTSIGLAALSRSDAPEKSRRPFYVYGDEFQSYTTLSIANMLAELRKYSVGLILANQFLDQLEPEVKSAVLGNVGTLIAFRTGAPDAQALAKEFSPELEPDDLIALPNRSFYVRMLVQGDYARPFSGETIEVSPAKIASLDSSTSPR